MRTLIAVVASLLALPLLAAPPTRAAGAPDKPNEPRVRTVPDFRVQTLADGLEIPWDVRPIGGGNLLFTNRDSARLTLLDQDGGTSNVVLDGSRVWVSGETGLMGLEIDPDFADNRRIYTCSGWNRRGGGHDVRVVAWRLNAGLDRATYLRTVIGGFPTSSGRHGGCRLLITDNGALLIGTGDAAQTKNPQSLSSLGGKTLRVDRMTGAAWPTNRWADAPGKKRFILTYGHRNVQGLAQRNDGTLWSVEHGTYRDDEVNLLRPGRNFGWQPGPGYDESPPMTDFSLPGKQYAARWSSGNPTIATSGASFVGGSGWGSLRGTLATAALAGSRLVFIKFDDDGRLRWAKAPAALREFGRLRSVTRWGRSLLVTTSNGSNDKILRITPR